MVGLKPAASMTSVMPARSGIAVASSVRSKVSVSIPRGSRDFDASLAQAIAHGATLDRGPFDYGSGRVAFLHGPEGHEIELMARAGKAAA